jgi:hypothetical protein
MANPNNLGPKFSEYGLRYFTNSLTKQEEKDLHKWRLKNDPDYREKLKVERLYKKKAAKEVAAKKAPAKKTSTTKKTTPKTTAKPKASVPRGRGGGVGGMFGVKNR